MIIYNKIGLANLRLQATMKKELQHGHITDAEFKAITEKYPVGFYTPGLFARVGLFILTCIVVSFAEGLLSLMFAASDLVLTTGWFLFLGLLTYVALEAMVRTKHHYRSGVDDALLFISGCLLVTGFAIMIWHNDDYLTLSGIIFILSLYFTLRFADMLTGAICCLSFFAFVFFGWTRWMPAGLITVPFTLMIVSAGVYWLTSRLGKQEKFINYQNCLILVQVISLVTLYAAGNYYIVQTLSNELNGQTGKPIPFGTIFWVWTIALPLAYLAFGIKKKDAVLLRTGLLLIAAAVLTFRSYYHVLPIDTTLTIAGAGILGIAYAIMKYLKTPKYGFTYAEPDDVHLMDHIKVESLLIAETFSTAPSAPANDGTKFGGGDFGGGGSSSGF
jgi:hypothetical protein